LPLLFRTIYKNSAATLVSSKARLKADQNVLASFSLIYNNRITVLE